MRFDYTFCFSSIRKFKKDSKEFYLLSVLDDEDTYYTFPLSSEEGDFFVDYEKHQDIKLPVRITRNEVSGSTLRIAVDHKRLREII